MKKKASLQRTLAVSAIPRATLSDPRLPQDEERYDDEFHDEAEAVRHGGRTDEAEGEKAGNAAADDERRRRTEGAALAFDALDRGEEEEAEAHEDPGKVGEVAGKVGIGGGSADEGGTDQDAGGTRQDRDHAGNGDSRLKGTALDAKPIPSGGVRRHAGSWRCGSGGRKAAVLGDRRIGEGIGLRRILLFVVCGSGLLGGCSGADVVNALTPRSGYILERDLAYGAGPRRRIDLYTPDRVASDVPLVVFFYGGRWQDGAKADFRFVAQAFAARGYPVAIPDYRLYPEVRWRGILDDGAAALAFLAARTDRPLVVVGHSAGAYVAAMLALDQGRLEAAGVPPCRIAGAIGLAGPYDFLPIEEADIKEVFGPGPAGPETQPITLVDANDPPMLLATGADDDTVRPRNTSSLARRLRDAGVPVVTRRYDSIGHIALVGSLAAPLRFLAPTLDDAVGFLKGLHGRCRR